MRQIVLHSLILGCLVLGIVPAAVAQNGPPADPAVEIELKALFERLVASVESHDNAGVDEVTCVASLVRAQLEREEALELVPDARDPELIAARRAEAREQAYAFVEELLRRGQEVESADASRVEIFLDADEIDETMTGVDGEELPITAQGILGIKMLTQPQLFDVDVCRVGERWCLNPLSMQ